MGFRSRLSTVFMAGVCCARSSQCWPSYPASCPWRSPCRCTPPPMKTCRAPFRTIRSISLTAMTCSPPPSNTKARRRTRPATPSTAIGPNFSRTRTATTISTPTTIRIGGTASAPATTSKKASCTKARITWNTRSPRVCACLRTPPAPPLIPAATKSAPTR